MQVCACHHRGTIHNTESDLYFFNISGKVAEGEAASSAQEAAVSKRKVSGKSQAAAESGAPSQYSHWLMKSEPESRFENGVDVKVQSSVLPSSLPPVVYTLGGLLSSDSFASLPQFGIEDLKALPDQTGCWDGVRNYQVKS